jgi:HAD superfamily hydrolase (TIGR01509 family)
MGVGPHPGRHVRALRYSRKAWQIRESADGSATRGTHHPGVTLTVNGLSVSWRIALAAAHDALDAGSQCLTTEEVHDRLSGLTREREQVERLLEADARVEHVRLLRRLSLPTATRRALGLPTTVDACIFELDGVLAPSADLHYAAWAETLDAFLAARFGAASVHLSHYARLSRRADYAEYLHGRPRLQGARALLTSRGITLPDGSPSDPPGAPTVHGFANAKNAALQARLAREGISAFADATSYLERLAGAGLACAVVSPSANTAGFLRRAGLTDLVDVVVDGSRDLEPKPAPDPLLAACEMLAVRPEHAAAFETSAAGVAAARTARIGLVVGVTRDEGDDVAGADRVAGDLGDMVTQPR